MFPALEKEIRLILTTFTPPQEAEQIAILLSNNLKEVHTQGFLDLRVIEDTNLILKRHLEKTCALQMKERIELFHQKALPLLCELVGKEKAILFLVYCENYLLEAISNHLNASKISLGLQSMVQKNNVLLGNHSDAVRYILQHLCNEVFQSIETIASHATHIINDLICERLNLYSAQDLEMLDMSLSGEFELDQLLKEATNAITHEYASFWQQELQNYSSGLNHSNQNQYHCFEQKFHQRLQRALAHEIDHTLELWCRNHDPETLKRLDIALIKSMALFDATSAWQQEAEGLQDSIPGGKQQLSPLLAFSSKGQLGRIR